MRSARPSRLSAWSLALLCGAAFAAPGVNAAAQGQSMHQTRVYAAASLSDVLDEQSTAFRSAHPFARVEFNFGGSNILARQILHGAPANLFIAADDIQMRLLEEAGRVEAGSAVPLIANRLVVVVPAAAKEKTLGGAEDLLRFRRLAIADPQGVPAGVYARTWLEREGMWKRLEERVVPVLDVRAALSAVASGNLPAGIVYATDAASSKGVRVVYEVPEDRAPRVLYYAAVIGGSNHLAEFFLDFLSSPRAAEIFRRHGFLTVGDGAKKGGPGGR